MVTSEAKIKFRSDPERKYREDRARQLARIKSGMKPQQKTIEKFKFTDEELGKVDVSNKLSIKSISEWMINNYDGMSDSTKKLHYGDIDNHINSNLYRIFKRFNPDRCDNDISICLGTMGSLIESIKSEGAPGTILRKLQSLSVAMEAYPEIDHLNEFKDQFQLLKKARDEMNAETQATNILRREEEELTDTFSQIKKKVCDKFGPESKECMYMRFYEEVPSRDDLGSVKFYVLDPKLTDENYLVILEDKPITFVLNKYKTSEIYGQIKTKLSKELSDDIRDFLIKQNTVYLFGKNKMSTFVGKMLKDVGVEGSGNITLLRKAYVSEKFENNKKMSAKDRLELAQSMKHSPIATLAYVRKFKEIKNKI